MNTKKHKNKSRTKVQPPQKAANVESKKTATDVYSVENLEVVSPEDVKHDVTVDLETDNQGNDKNGETKESSSHVTSPNAEETPVKPKRNKGKKKKHNTNEIYLENINDDSKKVEIVGDEINNIVEINPNDIVKQENLNIQPSSRKKKNKGKKHHTSSEELLTENKLNIEVASQEQNITPAKKVENVDETQYMVQSTNKKIKKKKRRLDSEKSEKTDEEPTSTSALNEIINANNESDSVKQDQESIIVSAENPDTDTQKESNFEDNLTKYVIVSQKKRKKEKKHPHKSEQGNQEVISSLYPVDVKSDSETTDTIGKGHPAENKECVNDALLECTIINEIKEGATIAKPVENKVVSATEKGGDMVTVEEMLNSVSPENSNSREIKVDDVENSSELRDLTKVSKNIKLPDILCQRPGDTEDFDKTQNNTDDFELDFKVSPNMETKEKKENIESEFMKLFEEISPSDVSLNEDVLNEQKHKENENLKEEVVKTTIQNDIFDNTPDFIQIPRSSSQQLFADNNNNTVIYEITSNDEIKLGIPVLTSSMIQGSGETPVSTPKITPTEISVTEIESILNRDQEKTDLKSKMLEVNQDMEELKMSLEKSLAELTAITETEDNIENKTLTIEASTTEFVGEIDKIREDEQVDASNIYRPLADRLNDIESKYVSLEEKIADNTIKQPSHVDNDSEIAHLSTAPPVCPSRKDRKSKGKLKKKGRREPEQLTSQPKSVTSETKSDESKDECKNEDKSKTSEDKGQQQSENEKNHKSLTGLDFEPIENFEDALTSSVDDVDVNKTFELIANEVNRDSRADQSPKESVMNRPEINITPPTDDTEKEKKQKNVHPVSQPKNLLGRPNIPVPSSKTDYKKEKNKTPNSKQAKVKIKDAIEPECDTASVKTSKQSQTDNKARYPKNNNETESFSYVTNEKEEYIYKYSFRKVFLVSVCHTCRKELKQTRLQCKFCNLLSYCSQKHKDEDWSRHQSLCFAISTIVHLKDQKHIYSDAKNLSGQDYRLIRMHMILSCEKVLNRKLLPWEQEALLYPRICSDPQCREWKQSKLRDCDGCGQVSYCVENPQHLSASHQRWCKSYALYQKLVLYQELNGRLEPKLPSKVMVDECVLPGKINEVLASMYDERIDMSDIQYAALTQLATAPLTTAFCYQTFRHAVNSSNGISKKSNFTVHILEAELQFEADCLGKWEVFLLHLKPEVQVLRVVLVGRELNPTKLPLELLGKIDLCARCHELKRRVQFSFQDKSYKEYWSDDDFIVPDVVCAFNPGIGRSSMYSESVCWPTAIDYVFKQKVPFVLTAHTLEELSRDLEAVKCCAGVNYKPVAEPQLNPFASVRPDRNFVTDEETPLLFKNNCFSVLCGV